MLSGKKLKEKILKDRYNSIIFKKSRGRGVYLVGGYIRDILRGKISKERDFTINAIAWSPDSGIIDPYKGIEDIKRRRISSLSEKNFKADPLRMLRAYRFAAELNGSIEDKTRRSIKTLYNKIKKVSSERITFELFNLLNSENPARYLNMALNDRILRYILSINMRALERNIKAIYRFKRQLKEHPKEVKVLLEEIFSQNITYKGLLLLELLLRRNGLFEPDRIPLIRISRNIAKRIILTHKGMKEFKGGKLFNFFKKSKGAAMDIIILKDRMDLIKEYIRFKNIWKKGMISSLEVARIGKIKAGPILGKVIAELKKAEFEREIKSKEEAIRLICYLT